MKSIPKRHQKRIVPQQRHPAGAQGGRFKPKPYTPDRMMRAQQIPTMMTATNGTIGEQ